MSITYGEAQENAAAALTRLIVTDLPPVEPAAVSELLACREAALDALRQRTFALDRDRRDQHGNPPPLPRQVTVTNMDAHFTVLLDRILTELPTMPTPDRPRPVDALAGERPDLTVELWRTTAVNLLAASHALDAHGFNAWKRDSPAAWHLVRDLAVTTEAVLILDHRLREIGLHHDLDQPQTAMFATHEARLITSQCSRVATWRATTDSPDLAVARTHAPPPTDGPVHLVREPADLAPAQRRLALYLRPTVAHHWSFTLDCPLDAATTRMILVSQSYLLDMFEQATPPAAATIQLRALFTHRRAALADLQQRAAHLTDALPREPKHTVVCQLIELTTATRRLAHQPGGLAITPAQMLDLAAATDEVLHTAALTLRRDLLRRDSNLWLRDRDPDIAPKQVTRKTTLERRLTHLARTTTPATHHDNPAITTRHRTTLRATVDATPPSTRAQRVRANPSVSRSPGGPRP